MPLVPHPPQSSRDAAADVAGARVGSGGARVGSGGSGGPAARVRAAGGDARSVANLQTDLSSTIWPSSSDAELLCNAILMHSVSQRVEGVAVVGMQARSTQAPTESMPR